MLNEEKENCDGAGSFGEDTSMYSLVSEAAEANKSHSHDSDESKSKHAFSESGANEIENGEELGLLILEGGQDEEDYYDDDEGKLSKKSASLSIPETVFLPSEIRSVAAVSCVTHEQGQNMVKESKGGNFVVDNILLKWDQLQYCLSRWSAGLGALGGRSFSTMQLFPALVIFVTLLSFASWRSHVWKNEVLRLKEEVQRQRTLLPLTLYMVTERESLLKKQKLLEQEVIELSNGAGPEKYDFEDTFSPDESSDDAILSFKSCYVEASLSLGRCSKDLQKWWSDSTETTESSSRDATEEKPNEYPSQDDGFTDDMSKIVRWGYDSLASTTTQSFSFIEKNLKHLSYVGIKDVIGKDDYIQSIAQSAPKMASNDTGDKIVYLNLIRGKNKFNRAISKLWNNDMSDDDDVETIEV